MRRLATEELVGLFGMLLRRILKITFHDEYLGIQDCAPCHKYMVMMKSISDYLLLGIRISC